MKKFKTIWCAACFLMVAGAFAGEYTVEVQGHRGARGRFPENTIPAFDYAVSIGVDVLELDMAVTKDNVIVISHDPWITPEICQTQSGKKLTDKILIHSLTLKEVRTYDCGAIRNPKFPEQHPVSHTSKPTLRELFQWIKKSKYPKAKTVQFNIETKIFPDHPEYTVGPEEFMKLVKKTIEDEKMTSRCILQSFDFRTLKEARKVLPNLRIAALVEDKGIDMLYAGKDLKADYLSPDFELLNRDVVFTLHQNGIKVIPWTVNEEKDWQNLIDMKVDGIISDYPDKLISFLKEKGLRPKGDSQ